jgi:hypothetical protein
MAITITKPTIGGSNNTWGQILNESLDTITDGLNGTTGTLSPDLEQGVWKIGGTTITVTGDELNIIDGDTVATATVVEGTDRIVFNDNGVMKQVSLSDIATYMQANGHANTSSQSSVNNSGSTYIQDITLDTYGHVTGITSATQSAGAQGVIVGNNYSTFTMQPNTTYQFLMVGASISQMGNVYLYRNNNGNDRLVNGIGGNGLYYQYSNGGSTQSGVGLGGVSGGTPGGYIAYQAI